MSDADSRSTCDRFDFGVKASIGVRSCDSVKHDLMFRTNEIHRGQERIIGSNKRRLAKEDGTQFSEHFLCVALLSLLTLF